jgi:hypothetical protein
LHKRLEQISNKISFANMMNQFLVMNQNGAGDAGMVSALIMTMIMHMNTMHVCMYVCMYVLRSMMIKIWIS